MRELVERWCDLSRSGRWACWFVLLLVAVAGGSYSHLTMPALPEISDTKAQWKRLMVLRQQSALPEVPPREPFSPLGFQATDVKLVSWQPSGRGGELVLDSGWRSIADLFSLLARSGTALQAFHVLPHAGALRITLTLEADDDR